MLIDRNINNKYLHIPEPIKLLKTDYIKIHLFGKKTKRRLKSRPIDVEPDPYLDG